MDESIYDHSIFSIEKDDNHVNVEDIGLEINGVYWKDVIDEEDISVLKNSASPTNLLELLKKYGDDYVHKPDARMNSTKFIFVEENKDGTNSEKNRPEYVNSDETDTLLCSFVNNLFIEEKRKLDSFDKAIEYVEEAEDIM